MKIIWKLGSLERGLMPNQEAIDKLKKFLEGDNVTDIIWGPDLEMIPLDKEAVDTIITEEYCINFLKNLGYKITKEVEV